MAAKKGWGDSPVVSATFTITGKVADVQFDPPAGAFDASTSVTLRDRSPSPLPRPSRPSV
jgi:hypothetical protein